MATLKLDDYATPSTSKPVMYVTTSSWERDLLADKGFTVTTTSTGFPLATGYDCGTMTATSS